MIREIILIIFALLLFFSELNAQAPESCECTVDTLGLKTFLSTLSLNENQPLAFETPNSNSTFAVLHGSIDNSTPSVVQSFIINNPSVTTLVFMQIPGSNDDNANLIASQALYNKGYKHYLPSVNAYSQDAFIASGGVDMFLSGTTRVVDVGAEVGVHSWSDGVNEATDFPVGHANHLPYINYYVSVGFTQQQAEYFYYFTINSAPANGIHVMTDLEINQYKTRTCSFSNSPDYTVSQEGNMLIADLSGASYQWIDCSTNSAITGETSQSFTPTGNDSYAVIVTENSCMDTSACTTVATVVIVEYQETNINVYPNPAFNNLNIDGKDGISQIEIRDFNGNLLKSINVNSINTHGWQIDISSLSQGVYVLRVFFKDSIETIRFVKME